MHGLKLLTAAAVMTAVSMPLHAGDKVWTGGSDSIPGGLVTWVRDSVSESAVHAQWDVFSQPFNAPNAPDEGFSAAVTGSTVTQTGTPTAFIIGAGTAGNIYSFAAATAFTVSLPGFADGTRNRLVISTWTDGSTWNYNSAQLSYVDGGTVVVPDLAEFAVFTDTSVIDTPGGPSASTLQQYQWVYDITGITAPLTWSATAAGSSMSFQQFAADAAFVPEPAGAALFLAGAALLGRRGRRC